MKLRPALKYSGAKWLLADWIISHFPPHETYLDVFGGSAAVLIQKPPAKYEIYNDLDMLQGWQMVTKETRNRSRKKRTECLMLNPAAWRALKGAA